MTALKTPVPLQTRVGIATGLVVVGDLIGSGAAQERGIVGETPNLAARLQGVAEPNMVVIAEGTRKLLGNLFDLKDLGLKELKGIAGPTRAFAALRAGRRKAASRRSTPSGLTALVGREEETRASASALVEGQGWRRAGGAAFRRGRHRQISADRGAPRTPLRRATDTSALFLLAAAYPQRVLSDHRPDGARCRTSRDDTAAVRLDKLDALLAQSSASSQDAALFAELLSLPNDGRYPALNLAPEQRRQKTLEAFNSQLEVLSRSGRC